MHAGVIWLTSVGVVGESADVNVVIVIGCESGFDKAECEGGRGSVSDDEDAALENSISSVTFVDDSAIRRFDFGAAFGH